MDCGRTTRAGTPCKAARPSQFHFACKQHATPDEARYGDLIYAAYREGHDAGRTGALGLAEQNTRRLEARIAELEADRTVRTVDYDGAQVVQVGRYAYRWTGPAPLAVGDEVWLPENYVSRIQTGPGAWRGTVTALGTHYTGPLATIASRAEGAA